MTLNQLEALIDSYKELNKAVDAALAVGCLDPNGKLFESIYGFIELMISIIDSSGWIEWYVYETKCGVQNTTVWVDGKSRKIKTVQHLYKLINDKRAIR